MPAFRRISVEPLSGACGAEIGGVDLSRPLDPEATAEIMAAFQQFLVIVFRNRDLTPDQHKAFSRLFGELADLFRPARRSLAMAIFGTANSIAFIAFFPVAGWIAQNHGWRAMFVAMGAPGIVLALVFLLTVREPVRHNLPPPRLGGSLGAMARDIRALFANRCFGWIFLGVTLMGANVWAAGAWTPTFFTRVHHMGMAEIAGTIGPARGVAGALGILAGGLIIDRLAADRAGWRIGLPALACLLSGPAELLFLMGDAQPLWLAGFALASLLTLVHQAPIYAATVGIVAEHRRALAIAVILFGASFIGNVVGPSAVGFATDLLTPRFGEEAVRYSMLFIAVTPMLSGLCFLRAATLFRTSFAQTEA